MALLLCSALLQAVQGGERGQRELQFYQRVFADDASHTLRELRPFLPAFHGTREVRGICVWWILLWASGFQRLLLYD
jgi:hypothetical protein